MRVSATAIGARSALIHTQRESVGVGRRSSHRNDFGSRIADRPLQRRHERRHSENLMRCAVFVLLSMVVAAPAVAHHSAARFDLKQSVTVNGVVTRYDWANPHVYIYVTETTAAGEAVEWEIEGQPPAMLRRMGWSRETLAVGDVVSLTGVPLRDSSAKTLLLSTMHKADAALYDGKNFIAVLNAGSVSGGAAAPSADGLDGVWVTVANFEVVSSFARPAARFQLTEAGAASVAAFDEATMSPSIDCVPLPAPAATIAPDVKRISVQDGSIRIAGEFDAGERVVHITGGGAEAPAPLPSIQGHSIGHWEGKTLVIETTGFAPHANGLGLGLKSSPTKRLVERLTLDDDAKGLTYEFEVVDSEVLAAPVTGKLHWVYRPDLAFMPEPCNRENARRFLK
jgi:Family of unknown function (DUF6152)